MPKKKEKQLSYLQMPLPEGRKYYKMTKLSWSGLNKRQTIDTGNLSMEQNISTAEAPYLTPSEKPFDILSWIGYSDIYKYDPTSSKPVKPICMYSVDDVLLVVYEEKGVTFLDEKKDLIKLDYLVLDPDGDNIKQRYVGVIGASEYNPHYFDERQRSVVQFNKYDVPTDALDGEYVKRLLVFPDKVSMPMRIENATSNPKRWTEDDLKDDLYEASTDVLYWWNNGNDKDDTGAIGEFYYYVTVDKDGNREVKVNGSQRASGDDRDHEAYFMLDAMDVVMKDYYNDTPAKDDDGNVIEPKEYPPPESANKSYYYRNTYSCEETLKGTAIFRYAQYDTKDGGTEWGWKVCVPPSVPTLNYATVHQSRLFGVSDDRVHASGFNDYTNWTLDSSGEYNESNAWCSPAQSNTKADGEFTGITTFLNHVICFKRDFMHEIYNTKNPFRIQDIYAEGCIDNRTIQDVDGKLIFVSEDDVKVYTGSNPRIIGYNLNISQYEKAVSGTDGRCYYLYCEDTEEEKRLFVYDTYVEQWSEQSIDEEVLSFAHNKRGMYMLCANGAIYKLDTGVYNHDWSFETDLITNKTVDIKHIKKIQMLADIADGANVDVYFLYDNEVFDKLSDAQKESRLVYASKGSGQKTIRVKPRQTAHYGIKLHIKGYGYVRLYELELSIEAGGDLYV